MYGIIAVWRMVHTGDTDAKVQRLIYVTKYLSLFNDGSKIEAKYFGDSSENRTFAHVKSAVVLRAFSSAGSEHLPYKQRVGGSNPSTPTIREVHHNIDEPLLFYIEYTGTYI